MKTRLLSATALALTLALPMAAGATQSSVSQETKVEQSTSASISTGASQLWADAKAQLNSAMATLGDMKDAAGEEFAEARANAKVAVDKLETALESAKDNVAESSREAWEATKQKLSEARAKLNDDAAKPDEIATSLGAVDEAAGEVEFESSQAASADTGTDTGGDAKADAKATADADAKAEAKSESGVLDKVGSALGVDSDSKSGVSVGTGTLQGIELVGQPLYGADQQEVGEIQDVVMSESGEVESVLVDVGGFLGIGAKRVAVPVENIEVQGEQMVAANLTKKQAEAMPEYKAPE